MKPESRMIRTGLPLLLALCLGLPTAGGAQVAGEPTSAPGGDVQAVQDTVLPEGVSPLGAFLRAAVLPTWGHAAIGSHRRGSFYLAAEGGTAWMLLRTVSRRSSARRVLESRETAARARIVLENPEATAEDLVLLIEDGLDADPLVVDARNRLEAREGQFEDWVAMGIFLTFLSGADAFVSAHLRDFPDPIDVQVGPSPEGGVQVAARLRLGFLR